jgi:hypothetical protein
MRYDPTDFGAAGDARSNDTEAFQHLFEVVGSATATIVIAKVYAVSGLVVPANFTLSFEDGGLTLIPGGTSVTINGPLAARFQQIFFGDLPVKFRPGNILEIYPEWWGAKGDGSTVDTSAVFAAIVASGTTMAVSTPPGGVIVGTITPIVFTAREYLIDAAAACHAYQIFRSRSRSKIRQTTSSAVHFLLGNAHRCEVTGIQFIGGKHAIQYYNNNTETGRLLVRDCSFQLTTGFAIRVGGSGSAGGAAAVTSSVATLAATPSTFTRSDGRSFIADGFVAGMRLTPSGFSNNMISTIAKVTPSTITVEDTRTGEGFAGARGLEGTYSLDTNSSNVLIENCEFYRCHSLWSATCDQFTARDCWISVHKETTPANTPQIVNLSFAMELDNFFGVPPEQGTPVALRWVDNYRRIYIQGSSRLGGENGGIAGVWHRGAPSASAGNAQGTAIEIYGGYATGGSANPTSGLVIFRENIPELLIIQGVRGLGSTGVIIEGPASVYAHNIVTSTYLSAFGTTVYDRFRALVDGNLMSSPTAVPAAYKQILLRRFDQILVDPLLTGMRALLNHTAAPLIDVTLDPGAGNDDDLAIHIEYKVSDHARAAHSVEAGYAVFTAARNNAAATAGAVAKGTSVQTLNGITMTVTFAVTVLSNVVTLKVTNDTSNGDGSVIYFRGRVINGLRSGTSYALASGVSWDAAGG